ncbi:MAG: hypothetical protein Q8N23_36505 [Archangium sp.]|nr:hypothetical protein [Archangium sp.]MDP3158232.1 hypothetical protein [Archangium sp.]MDP3572477.1 hypothetical protein [Archangium sp.]
MRRALLPLCLLCAFTVLWPRVLRAWFQPDVAPVFDRNALHPLAAGLAAHQVGVWTAPGDAARDARQSNPEWDFMGRTFLAWSAANMALRDPARKAEHLETIDRLISRTLDLEAKHGFRHFLMRYGQADTFVAQPARSLFVDGEIALMLALRRVVEDRWTERVLLQRRLGVMEAQLRASPLIAAESYPDECWTFDHANAMAAFRIADVLDGSDHSELISAWLRVARERLIDPSTGLLVSSYRLDGTVKDGPEGSTIWLTAHALDLIDPVFAADQYARARLHLDHSIAGFWLAREWPKGSDGRIDIDSGVQLPIVEASPSSSAFALMAAANFGDREALSGLMASLTFAAFPVEDSTGTHFAASNAVGDSVILYALTLGPAWDRVKRSGR